MILHNPESSGAESGALGAQPTTAPPADPNLALLVAAWPTLPPAIRAGVLALVKATHT